MADLRSLEVFYWTATLCSFRQAAERLNTTQPAVSQRIAALEEGFGVKLFERRARSVCLTAKGRDLLVYAERFLRLRTEMMAAIASPGTMRGVLRLGVAETIVHTWLMRFIEAMSQTYPGVTVDISVDISPNMREALLARDLDLAFMVGPITMPSLVNLPLCSYSLAWIAAPQLDVGPGEVALADLMRFPIITYPKNTTPYVQLRDLLARSNLPPPRLHSNASLSTIVRMTLEGIGICVIPPAIVRREIESGQLRVLSTQVHLPDIGFTATYANAPDCGLAAPAARLACAVASGTSHG
ncbi:LysR family transcriptional regulator [Methylobacterium isbiliense]|jgi:DNA-binding transcriptional LysR family regulator|uniref:HTH-type transcriptional regulator GltR n=1 Tax=Methylobacterium isbiliense TaxID=315478 RepID=A0ABQ4SEL7_9HYPH|nr:LysR family transcriptional regulator [Methylobacterium isbiliense]MDN3622349.1 LysR family transcriptional regulator [Methylobacterium isbiliense]GJE01620.1 HTH-type transcriptional regulator GltR [Methylobacterium isbiliense]